MARVPFFPNPAASDFFPSCPANNQHEFVSDRRVLLNDGSALSDFEHYLESARHLALFYHLDILGRDPSYDLFAFKIKCRVFVYSILVVWSLD